MQWCFRLWSTVTVECFRWTERFSSNAVMLLWYDDCLRNFTQIKTVMRSGISMEYHGKSYRAKLNLKSNRSNTGLDVWQKELDENCLHFYIFFWFFLPLSLPHTTCLYLSHSLLYYWQFSAQITNIYKYTIHNAHHKHDLVPCKLFYLLPNLRMMTTTSGIHKIYM